MEPQLKPRNPNFSSGPCAKYPGWQLHNFPVDALGRSHRAGIGKKKLSEVIDLSREILGIPGDYRVGIVPGSDTGAFEMAMWTILGKNGIDVLAWESFGLGWLSDIQKQLKIDDIRSFTADYGKLPDLSKIDSCRDIVFTWNGTTSGVKVPHAKWIKTKRQGLTLCDATSAVFAMDLPWDKLDVVTWSWQKVLGGEGAHGMIVLSPAAVERLEKYTPNRPLPKLFRLTKGGKLIEGIFKGETINTPSLLCVEDVILAMKWVKSIGGLPATIQRSQDNLAVVKDWVQSSDWAAFLAVEPNTISNTSICLKVIDPWYEALSQDDQKIKAKQMVTLLEKKGVAYDIGAYRDAPAGLRIWGGATVETDDIRALLPWLDWAFSEIKKLG